MVVLLPVSGGLRTNGRDMPPSGRNPFASVSIFRTLSRVLGVETDVLGIQIGCPVDSRAGSKPHVEFNHR